MRLRRSDAFQSRLGLLILMVLGGITYESTQRLMRTSYLVTHSNDVLNVISDSLSDLQDVETGQRGYIITGKDEFLAPYTDGVASWKKSVERLRDLTSDNSRHQRRLDALQTIARDRDTYERELVLSRKKLEALVAEATRLQLELKDRALFAEQMVGIVSHDLRNPLSTIQMGAALLSPGWTTYRPWLGRVRSLKFRASAATSAANVACDIGSP